MNTQCPTQFYSCESIRTNKSISPVLWHAQWDGFLNERSVSSTAVKSFYTHKKLKSAYLSLKRNLPVLFTFEDYPQLSILNTANALDGSFSDLKNKPRNHNGLSKNRKMKFIT
jgi:hypothetical protein